ncbi:DUF6944 family repetitive protein [Peribacillus sp. NPDC006672]|uniref:DUF6944 family repetitive protein n=1 Tax=Peribacillus sp. NPDC006672 TaxID=3390606 RepID=UPI003D04FABC
MPLAMESKGLVQLLKQWDSSYRVLGNTGNGFISLGFYLAAIGNIYVNEKSVIGEQILLVGSWIQFIGAIILIHAIPLELEHIEQEKHEENPKNRNGNSYNNY